MYQDYIDNLKEKGDKERRGFQFVAGSMIAACMAMNAAGHLQDIREQDLASLSSADIARTMVSKIPGYQAAIEELAEQPFPVLEDIPQYVPVATMRAMR